MTQLFSRRAMSRVLGVFALVAIGGAAVQAQEAPQAPGAPGAAPEAGGGGGRGGRGQRGGRQQQPAIAAFKATSPTPEQQTKFDALQVKMRDDMMALRNGGSGNMRDINQKFQDDVEALLTPAQQKVFKLEMAKATGDLAGQMEALALTPEQLTQVRPLLRDTQEELRKLRTDTTLTPETRPAKVEAILKDLKAKVRPLLTTEQQTKLDTLELKAAPARGGGRGGRGGNGGGNGGGQAPAAPAANPAR